MKTKRSDREQAPKTEHGALCAAARSAQRAARRITGAAARRARSVRGRSTRPPRRSPAGRARRGTARTPPAPHRRRPAARPRRIARRRRSASGIPGAGWKAPSRTRRPTASPVSSKSSRRAVASRSSPGSARPPGKLQRPSKGGRSALHHEHAVAPQHDHACALACRCAVVGSRSEDHFRADSQNHVRPIYPDCQCRGDPPALRAAVLRRAARGAALQHRADAADRHRAARAEGPRARCRCAGASSPAGRRTRTTCRS